MGLKTENVCELLPSEPCDLYAPRRERANSRTLLKRYFLDPVLPVLTLLSMSVLTVAMLVVIVTTVADMDLQLPGSYVNVDPWSGVSLGPAGVPYQDQATYADFVTSMDTTEDRELWSDAQVSDPF
jgi:hypothetical protein